MKNQYFDFKHFRIYHNKTAMKVGTDGVLLGSIVNCKAKAEILDVGTGSGLIALMMAQRFPKAKITGIEPESNACNQAVENCKLSPWNNRIKLFQSKLENFQPQNHFDCIVSNPPFYKNALNSTDKIRAKSRQAEYLPPEQLLEFSAKYLSQQGSLWIIYPNTELHFFEKYVSDYHLHINQLIFIKPNILKAAHRIVLEIKKGAKKQAPEISMFCIEILKRHDYSEHYKSLCKDFYLNF